MLDEAFEKKAWHGPNLRGSLRGVSANEAAWRPGRGRHNIWEIAVHAAYWKYAVRRRLLGEKRGSFALKGSNWFTLPSSATEEAWKNDVALLIAEHQRLRDAIAALPLSKLQETSGMYTITTLIYGIANHDIYHAGQIQLLKRLYSQRF
jgi:uncharacterized damage-inducible protein DinB